MRKSKPIYSEPFVKGDQWLFEKHIDGELCARYFSSSKEEILIKWVTIMAMDEDLKRSAKDDEYKYEFENEGIFTYLTEPVPDEEGNYYFFEKNKANAYLIEKYDEFETLAECIHFQKEMAGIEDLSPKKVAVYNQAPNI